MPNAHAEKFICCFGTEWLKSQLCLVEVEKRQCNSQEKQGEEMELARLTPVS